MITYRFVIITICLHNAAFLTRVRRTMWGNVGNSPGCRKTYKARLRDSGRYRSQSFGFSVVLWAQVRDKGKLGNLGLVRKEKECTFMKHLLCAGQFKYIIAVSLS